MRQHHKVIAIGIEIEDFCSVILLWIFVILRCVVFSDTLHCIPFIKIKLLFKFDIKRNKQDPSVARLN